MRGNEGYLLLVQLHMNLEVVTLKNSTLEVVTVTFAVTLAAAGNVMFWNTLGSAILGGCLRQVTSAGLETQPQV